MSLEAGAQLGEYRILSRIGAGASGEVFEAEHVITRRRDAIKVLVDGHLHIHQDEQRFLREIQVQASLQHPNIAAVYTAFPTPYGLALVMELVRGEPLSAILARGRIPLHLGIGLFLEMLEGLSYAHTHGVVHRDIKPENIIVTNHGSVKLTDFGLARSLASPRLTQLGAFAGSPAYMSPEQGLGSTDIDARSDTYSAGVVLYEIVTGRLPFQGETAFAVMLEHQTAPPPPPVERDPTIGADLDRVILTSLEKDLARRFQTAEAFHTAVQQAASHSASTPPAAPDVRRPSVRTLTVGVACFLLAAAGLYSFLRHRPATHAAVPAPRASEFSQTVQTPVAPVTAAQVPPQSSSGPTDVPPSPNPAPTISPDAKVTVPVRKYAPPTAKGLRITGSLQDEPSLPPRTPMQRPAPMEYSVPSTPEAPPPPNVDKPAMAAAAPVQSPEVTAESADPTSAKRRNFVVRTLQRVFRPRVPARPNPAKLSEPLAVKHP
jgi:serine/threonine-protein kinase